MKEKQVNYEEIGLKSGLEIHQQLNTKKLFCSCHSILRNDEPIYKVKRELKAVVGETGQIDVAAKHEEEKKQTFEYLFFDSNCLVELDEEPPHEINKDALKIAIQIALLLNCKIAPVTQVMRKTVIDGSNTSGFQRTALFAYDGYIETSLGRVRIDTVAIEEDSARKVKSEDNLTTFNLDRLGIPLVEIATAPDLKTPEQVKEAALKIGEILRACDVKRGLGTIRQDVNVSIKGSKRVEIKGFQDPKIMIKTVNEEIKRQQKCLVENKCESEVRRTLPSGKTEFLRPMPGSARMYPETDLPLLKISRELINEAKKTLPKLSSENRKFLKDSGLKDELLTLVLKENKLEDYKTLLHTIKNPELIAKSLTLFQKEISKKENKTLEEVNKILNTHVLEEILSKVDNEISSNDVKNILQKLVQGKSLKEATKKADINLSEEIEKIVKEKPGLSTGAYMGLVMAKFKGQVSGKEVSDELKKILK